VIIIALNVKGRDEALLERRKGAKGSPKVKNLDGRETLGGKCDRG